MPQHTTGTSVSSHPTNEEKDKGEEEKEKKDCGRFRVRLRGSL